jgi:hypothetical protein
MLPYAFFSPGRGLKTGEERHQRSDVPEISLERALKVPAEPGAEALGELLKAIEDQEGPWHGFALHVGLGELRLPDVGYVAVPIRLTAAKRADDRLAFDLSFVSTSIPAAFPAFKGEIGLRESTAIGESSLYLHGEYQLPMQLFGRLIDAALLPAVARRALENFIEEISTACEARVNQREAEFIRYQFYTRKLL